MVYFPTFFGFHFRVKGVMHFRKIERKFFAWNYEYQTKLRITLARSSTPIN